VGAQASAVAATRELNIVTGWSDIARATQSRSWRGEHRARPDYLKNTLIVGMIACFVVAYSFILVTLHSYYGSSAATVTHQQVLEQQFSQGSAVGGAPEKDKINPPPGWAVARITIPKLKQHWIVVEGTTKSDIANAPGHYTGTALPGHVGNFAVAGHRSPTIFADVDRLKSGDVVLVDTRTSRYTYTITGSEVVTPDRLDVIAPVPGHPGQKAKLKMLTLTTCDPWWDITHRLVIYAQLTKTEKLNG
jgi:sortase A